ncbi:hypothetical protein NPIL_203601, partial [Nephila pilipes]
EVESSIPISSPPPFPTASPKLVVW